MTSTEFSIGMTGDGRSSSRVLKPPGGASSNIFGASEVHVPSPRPKYDQQNSSNLNFCMNTVDPNILVEQKKQEIVKSPESAKPAAVDAGPKPSAPPPPPPPSSSASTTTTNGNGHGHEFGFGFGASEAPPPAPASAASAQSDGGQSRGNSRVPPGGFSSGGFW